MTLSPELQLTTPVVSSVVLATQFRQSILTCVKEQFATLKALKSVGLVGSSAVAVTAGEETVVAAKA